MHYDVGPSGNIRRILYSVSGVKKYEMYHIKENLPLTRPPSLHLG